MQLLNLINCQLMKTIFLVIGSHLSILNKVTSFWESLLSICENAVTGPRRHDTVDLKKGHFPAREIFLQIFLWRKNLNLPFLF
jgi:hypothetical protein